jgi:hypothetical protein
MFRAPLEMPFLAQFAVFSRFWRGSKLPLEQKRILVRFNAAVRDDLKGRGSQCKEAEYRSFAATCLDVAKKTSDSFDKTRLLAMAEAWLGLAQRASRTAQPHSRDLPEHPLVRNILGGEGPDLPKFFGPRLA